MKIFENLRHQYDFQYFLLYYQTPTNQPLHRHSIMNNAKFVLFTVRNNFLKTVRNLKLKKLVSTLLHFANSEPKNVISNPDIVPRVLK